MANDILVEYGTLTDFTITLTGLANGSGQSTASVDNTSTKHPFAKIFVEMTSGTSAPTAGATFDVYYLEHDDHGSDPVYTDNWVGTNASFTPENAVPLGAIVVDATTSKEFRGQFDTKALGITLGPKWGIAVVNNSGTQASTTSGDSFARYLTYRDNVA